MPELTLHIGSGKTGSSAIQAFLDARRPELRSHGVLYPRSPGATRHVRLGLALRENADLVRQPGWEQQAGSDPAGFRARVRGELLAEVAESGAPRVLISDEALYGATGSMLQRLTTLTEPLTSGGELRVLVYLRRQDDHLVSRYQQVVKTGETRRLVDRVEQVHATAVYDYRARLQLWQRRTRPGRLVVRPYETSRFVGGSLLSDLVAAAELPLDPGPEADRLHNPSLDAETTELLRLVNLVRAEGGLGEWRVRDQRRLADRLAELSSGPTLTLPEPVLERFMAPWEEGNRSVAREYLGRSELFTAPRRTTGTTTVQRLEPERARELLSRVELPAAARAAVLATAHAEAGGSR